MIKKIAKFFAIFFLAIPMIVLAGCRDKIGNRVIFSFTDELETMLEMYYEDNPTPKDEQFKVQIIPYEEFTNQLTSRFRSGKNIPALVTLEEKPSRAFIERKYFTSLDTLITDDNDMYEYTFNAGKFNNVQYGLSWQATPGGFFFRTDIAKQFAPTYLGITESSTVDEIVSAVQTKISTWDGFIELASVLHSNSNGGVKILSSSNDPSRVFISNRKTPWVEVVDGVEYFKIDKSVKEFFETIEALEIGNNSSGKAISTSDRFVNGSNDSDTTWFADMNTTIAQFNESRSNAEESDDLNIIFGYFLPTWGLHYQLKENGTDTSGHWAVAPGPQAFSDGGTWLAVSEGHQYAKEAKDIVKYITTNKAFLKAWAEQTGDFVNSKSVMQQVSSAFTGDEFLGGQNHYDIFMNAAETNDPGPLSKYDVYISNTAVRSWAINFGVRTNGDDVGIKFSEDIDEYFQALAEDVKSNYPVIDILNWKTW